MANKMECIVVDAGARYGLHPTWQPFKNVARFELFEMETEEAARLEKQYRHMSNITVHPLALYHSDCTLRFKMRQHRGLVSLYDNNEDFRQKASYMEDESKYDKEREIEARSIDSVFANSPVHFLKIDTEGAELDVLRGAAKHIDSSILGVRAEINFEEIYDGIPLFGDIHNFMRERNFSLVNLDYHGRGHAAGEFTMPDRYGYLISSEAVWIKHTDLIIDQDIEKTENDVVLLCLFLLHNNASDIALDLLQKGIRKGINLAGDDVFVRLLCKEISFLFKSLLGLPGTNTKHIHDTYKMIFDREFPQWNHFHEIFNETT